jgi:hypothetical protein
LRELNFAVQRIIDRIIFLRISEDRGVESYGRLLALTNGPNIYPRLCEIFADADAKFNSGLFHFKAEKGRHEPPDELTLGLDVDDKLLRELLQGLYYPESPYEFTVISSDILGQVYEQFLGKVIRLTAGHHAVVEDKPEVKKAGGVYYTPTYIVDYIVRQTVGKLIEGKTPKQAAKLRVLDPACGSGSFLINAYQYLLDWHRDWYVAHKPEGWVKGRNPALVQTTGGWKLTIAERKRILLDNIYGVDIDPQAVEVTKLSLLLKVLEGESEQTIQPFLRLFQQRALPDLGDNIKCGNSLIGPEAFQQARLSLLPEADRYRINMFDWSQGFPDIMKSGGFDVVMGNPPYIRIQMMKEWAPTEVELYKTLYKSASSGNYDIYVVFVEKALSLLNRTGRMGFILPHKFFNSQYGEGLREIISRGRYLSQVVHFGDQQVFSGATTYTCMLFLDKSGSDKCQFIKVEDLTDWCITGQATRGAIPPNNITAAEWNFAVGQGMALFERLSKISAKLGNVTTGMFVGQQTSADTVYLFKDFRTGKKKNTTKVFSKELGEWVTIESRILKPVVRSGDIHRYSAKADVLVLFPYELKNRDARLFTSVEMEAGFPLAWDYLNRNKKILENREKGKFKDAQWYRFGRTQNLGMWEQPKLMIPYMITELAAYLDQSDNYYFINVTTGGYGITGDESSGSLTYLCGLLNSRLLDFYFKRVSTPFHGGYFAANKQYIEQLPIRPIDFSSSTDTAIHGHMVKLVDQMIDLRAQLSNAKTPHENEALQRQIDATDKQIDQLVYQLYGLTDEEIKIVEGAS